jgi:ribosome-associated protein
MPGKKVPATRRHASGAPGALGWLKRECEITAFRAGGPGGQHQNATDSAVRLVHRPSGIVVVARSRRSQRQNIQEALERLAGRLSALGRRRRPRVPTRKGRGVRERELAEKKRRSTVKLKRRRPESE